MVSHRALALFRGRQEGVLTLKMLLTEDEEALPVHPCQVKIADFLGLTNKGRALDVAREVPHHLGNGSFHAAA